MTRKTDDTPMPPDDPDLDTPAARPAKGAKAVVTVRAADGGGPIEARSEPREPKRKDKAQP